MTELWQRKVQLSLSLGMAVTVLGLARMEKRKRQREHLKAVKRGWKPEEGRYDRNLMRIAQMNDIIQQLEPKMVEHGIRNRSDELSTHDPTP
jgi:hypothetical protein